ncbi:MAG: hypothetical protein QM664_03175, partial [Flavihumibacter sp.]
MKKLFATIAMGLVISGAMAQDSTLNKRGPHHGKRAPFGDLELTAEQKSQMAQLRKEQHEKMMAILTPEQKAKLAQKKNDRHNLKETLKLTDEQADKMKVLNDRYREQARLIRANTTLAEAQQKAQLKKLSAEHRSEVNAMLTPAQQES